MAALLIERVGATAVLTLNRPEARNALDYGMRAELAVAVPAAARIACGELKVTVARWYTPNGNAWFDWSKN